MLYNFMMDDINQAIEKYFLMGFEHKDILDNLIADGYEITLRTLQRRLKALNLYRRKSYTPLEDVVDYLENALKKSTKLHGYRWHWLRMILKGYNVKQMTVEVALQHIDPDGVAARSKGKLSRRVYHSEGANFMWHQDGYDKLKPYGICISGAVDGFSRYILWLRANQTNNDPRVIGGYYLDAVEEFGGIPKTVRSDMGTENGVVKSIQEQLRSRVQSQRPAFLYGKSIANQRIESWWSILRKHNAQFWMDEFKRLIDKNLFNGGFLHKNVIRYTFTDIIQGELDEIRNEWNVHRIRRNKKSESPSGKPAVLFRFPEKSGKTQCLIPVDKDDLTTHKLQCTYLSVPCDEDVLNFCNSVLTENGLPIPDRNMDVEVALSIYEVLIKELEFNQLY